MKRIALILVLWPAIALAANPKSCVTADEATQMPNKDVCVTAHVYDVVELADGTRYLDTCSPDTPDERCKFTIVSLRAGRDEVGELRKYLNKDVSVRGTVQPMHGRSAMILNHARQLQGGSPKFKPNPLLLHGFTGEQSKPPVSDPNLRSQGGHRAFMNSHDQAPLR
jgi:hypothetical protein